MKKTSANTALIYGALFLTGLHAGIHFFNYLGFLPALQDITRPETLVDFWQKIDFHMAMRMRIVVPIMLLLNAFVWIWAIRRKQKRIAWGFGLALALFVADVLIAINGNMPMNKLVQSWSLDAIPPNWQGVREQMIMAFHARGACSIVAFAIELFVVMTP